MLVEDKRVGMNSIQVVCIKSLAHLQQYLVLKIRCKR